MSSARPQDPEPTGESVPQDNGASSGTASGSSGEASAETARALAPDEPLNQSVGVAEKVGLALVALVGALAVATLVWPSLLPGVPRLPVALGVVGVGILYLAARPLLWGVTDEPEQADPPLVEFRSTVRVPGEAVDADLLEGAASAPLSRYRKRQSVLGRLRDLVVETLVRDGTDREAALEQVEDGTWSDDPVEASLGTLGTPFDRRERLRLRLDGDTPFRYQARQVIDRLARKLDVLNREWTDPETPLQAEESSAVADGWIGQVTDLDAGDREPGRLRLAGGLALLSIGIGLILGTPALLLAGSIGAGVLAYGYASAPPDPQLAVERRFDETDPGPGQEVVVTVAVENAGEDTLVDLRLIDGVPESLGVERGTPRHGATLKPGATATFSYTVTIDRGTHEFDPLLVVARSASGAVERTGTVGVENGTALVCEPSPEGGIDTPVRAKTTRDVGRIVTDTGGSGIEFHSVREYQSGDPLKRIDWNRTARGGELATLQFREEHAATVVLVVDARPAAFVARHRDARSAVARSLDAVGEVFLGRLDSDDRVGLTALSTADCWLPPGAGQGQWALAKQLLTAHDAFTAPDTDAAFSATLALRQLRMRLPADAQVVLFSPLCDDTAVALVRRLQAHGYLTTVVSPDTTGTETPGRTVAHLERRLRLSRLRDADVRVIDWAADEPLRAATDRARRRWSR